MKVRSESEWQARLAELAQDPDPFAQVLKELVIAWADAAEKLGAALRENSRRTDLRTMGPAELLRRTLPAVEINLGRMPTVLIGQALVLLYHHWDTGTDPDVLFEGLTPIEQHIYEDITALKLAVLQEQAKAQP